MNLCSHKYDFGISAEWDFFFQKAMENLVVIALVKQLNEM